MRKKLIAFCLAVLFAAAALVACDRTAPSPAGPDPVDPEESLQDLIENADRSLISMPKAIEQMFDLSEEKIRWNGDVNGDFDDSTILIAFKSTEGFPELPVKCFGFPNAESIDYISLRPPATWSGNPSDYRQFAVIELKEHGKRRVVEAALYFDRLSILYLAGPDYINEGASA